MYSHQYPVSTTPVHLSSARMMERRPENINSDLEDVSSQCAFKWDITERDFWLKKAVHQQEQSTQISQRYNHDRSSVITNMRSAEAEIRELREKKDKLSRELAAIRSRTAGVNETYKQAAQRLSSIDSQHITEKRDLIKKHEKTEVQMNDWFRRCRIQDGVHERRLALPGPVDNRTAAGQLKLPPLANLHLPRDAPKNDDRFVVIIDADHTVLDKLQYPRLSNERTRIISSRAVLQPIKLRNASRFFEDTRPSIYSFADGKGTGWIACMIQATGFLQKKKCHGCSSNESPFEGCIAVGGHLFPKCGNCEWNGTGCQGFEPSSSTNILARRPPALEPSRSKSHSSTPGYSLDPSPNCTAAELEAMAAAAQEASVKAYSSHCSPPQAHISGFKAVNQTAKYEPGSPVPSAVPSLTGSSSTSYRRYKVPASGCSLPRQVVPITFHPMESTVPNSCDITRETLVLRHNNAFYTYPKCIEGVPVEKITPSHPYWEPKWPDLRTCVEPILRSWEEKYQAAEEASRQGESGGSVKYHYGRQVKRGNRILKFLEQGAISPYQLLSKRFMGVGKGSITSYDTLFRLCDTIEALANYKTDVEPVDWLRQRLHELIEAQGTGFNFSKTIHDFYSDPKLSSLRQKSGFMSIGRPSGIKMPRRRAESLDEATPLALRSRKRKSDNPYDTPSPPAEPLGCEPSKAESAAAAAAPSTAAADDEGPVRKKQKAAAKVLDSLETGGEVSDTDSFCGAPIAEYDFRLYQIKTRLFTSSESVTQYWRRVTESKMFEHQVLESTDPVVWSVHRDPIDFSLEDVAKISWNLKAQRMYLVMRDRHIRPGDGKPRGDIMVAFKRLNTMRRFIKCCRQEEIELVEETWKKMEYLWGTMQSERLLVGEEEACARWQG